ncbi:MAG: hypothetical protein Sylvanvirus35_3 [Sylvanvirus sp.]|uniref:Uncharacterized protein n=1 Tax=Sylvanvirus sp. TaxID=2487774 RepID=A0A3G5AJ28_9VIRU|nr:MAG: hypothetical protein Sylvanvirus35_3 [Sylvanvirus sp.]
MDRGTDVAKRRCSKKEVEGLKRRIEKKLKNKK